jgi:carbon-monoxide dehydrogenase large subunit
MLEIDRETGEPKLLQLVAVDDAGHLINPLIVEGQIHGGLAQGIGQAMIEEVVYNSDGQLVTGSFMDYALPRAIDFPRFELDAPSRRRRSTRSARKASAKPARSARRRASCRRRSTR